MVILLIIGGIILIPPLIEWSLYLKELDIESKEAIIRISKR